MLEPGSIEKRCHIKISGAIVGKLFSYEEGNVKEFMQ